MFAIDRIPTEALRAAEEHGIATEQILLAAHADRTPQLDVGDVYLFATEEELLLLGGVVVKRSDPKRGQARVQTGFQVLSCARYKIKELHHFVVEELLSAGRLVAKYRTGERAGEPCLLASFTNFCKASIFLFAKYANCIADGEKLEIDPKDDPAAGLCPTCGMRYPDLNRRVCPHCMERGKLFRRFSVFFLRYRAYLILSILSLVLVTAMGILTPYLSSGFFYDEVIDAAGEYAGQLFLVLVLVLSANLMKMGATMINNCVTSVVAAKVVFDLKKTIFTAIERLSLGFFTGRQTGGLMTQVNEDANTIYTFFCDSVPYLLINAAQVLVLSILLFTIQPILALVSLVTVPLFLLLMRYMVRRLRMYHAKRYSHSRRMNSFLGDVFSGMRVVKAFSKEEEEIRRFTGRNEGLAESEKTLSLYTNYSWPLAHQILHIGNIIAWAVGGWMVIVGQWNMTYGILLTFVTYINMIFSPLEFFVNFIDRAADCTNSMQRLFEIMDAQPEVSEREDPLRPVTLGGQVEFDHVSFSYQKGKRIIDDVSFSVEDGKILGIVGHTGAGKSTLANLILRMYDVEDGEIRIGGYPVKDLALSTLYRNIAIVSQETYLFMGSILDNIRYARPDASFEEVIEAAKCAGAHDFIIQLPDAYHTRIGFGYRELSGGERQRISIARAILKNPKILILDEATASMDTATERRIQAALTELTRGKTTIMIAHRLSTLRDAHSLVVIEHGRVVEVGTHAELLAREDGVYHKLYTLQDEALKSAGIRE